ncbi:Crp/Fnr family transcriptional regulator [Parasediminibacterium sp. JCM 36343]|uniref:Crp/Fnr family transcriptional regulator n=1 Tax=Parasediminibacterium sp. JCM 36343 TaxID=3374279 RepID=UPI003978ECF3
MESLVNILHDDGLMTSNLKLQIQQKLQTRHLAKSTMLQKQGDTACKCYFVKTGLLRSYAIDEKGKEHIFMFAPEGWIMGDIVALASSKPSDLYIDVLETSEVEVFTKDIFEILFSSTAASGKTINTLLLNRNAVLQKRVIMLMSATALERYEDFLEIYPNIAQRIPQKMIASYLGITPEALSKIRHDRSKLHSPTS